MGYDVPYFMDAEWTGSRAFYVKHRSGPQSRRKYQAFLHSSPPMRRFLMAPEWMHASGI